MTENNELCFLDEIIIEGMTVTGEIFRPRDWVDRLCGMLAGFEQKKMSYSPYLRPLVYKDMNCVAVKKDLEVEDKNIYNFIMQFASDNKLSVVDCANFKRRVGAL